MTTTTKPTLPREVWLLVCANVVVALGYGVVAPVLPSYARHFGVSVSAATFVITAFAVMRLVGAPPAGYLVQRLGERRIYISGLLIVAVSTGACAFAQTYTQLLVFRSAGGIGSAMFTVSSLGLMIRISPPDARGRVAGLFASGFLVGSVGGPVLGSLTAGLGLAAPFLIYGAALLVAAAVVFVSLRHSAVAAPEISDEPTVSMRIRRSDQLATSGEPATRACAATPAPGRWLTRLATMRLSPPGCSSYQPMPTCRLEIAEDESAVMARRGQCMGATRSPRARSSCAAARPKTR